MANILAANVSYAIVQPVRKLDSSERETQVDVTFGNGALTYPTNGIPYAKASLGCPNSLSELRFNSPSAGDGFVYKHDVAHGTIRIYESGATNASAAALTELVANTATPAATTIRVIARGW